MRFDRVPLLLSLLKLGRDAPDVLDVMERIKLIEGEVLGIEGKRYEFDKEEREREQARKTLMGR